MFLIYFWYTIRMYRFCVYKNKHFFFFGGITHFERKRGVRGPTYVRWPFDEKPTILLKPQFKIIWSPVSPSENQNESQNLLINVQLALNCTYIFYLISPSAIVSHLSRCLHLSNATQYDGQLITTSRVTVLY